MKKKSFFLKSGWKMLLFVAFLALILILNGLLPTLSGVDLTAEKYYTLGEKTLSFLSALQDDVQILYTCANDERLMEILNRYAHASSHIHLQPIETSITAYYTGTEMAENSIIVTDKSGAVMKAIPADSIYAAQYISYSGTSQLIDLRLEAENQLTNAIAYVTGDYPVMYLLKGHAETALEIGVTDVLCRTGYRTRDLYLSETGVIPQDCALILINAPLGDLTENECTLLSDYLAGGGKVVLTTNAKYGVFNNLASLLNNVGLNYQSGIVVEGNRSYMFDASYPYYIIPALSNGQTGASLVALSGAIVCAENNGWKTESVLQTSDASFFKPNAFKDGKADYVEGDLIGPFTVGAIARHEGGMLFWVPSEQWLLDAINSYIGGANYSLLSDILTEAHAEYGESSYITGIEGHSLVVQSAKPTQTQRTVTITACIAVPVLLLVIGIVVTVRKNRKYTPAE